MAVNLGIWKNIFNNMPTTYDGSEMGIKKNVFKVMPTIYDCSKLEDLKECLQRNADHLWWQQTGGFEWHWKKDVNLTSEEQKDVEKDWRENRKMDGEEKKEEEKEEEEGERGNSVQNIKLEIVE